MNLTTPWRYGLFGGWVGLHVLALFFSSYLIGALALSDLVILFVVLPLSPPPALPEMPTRQTEDKSEEHTLSLLEYLRDIESGFHQRLDDIEGMLEENTMLTRIRRRRKGALTLVPNEGSHTVEPSQDEKGEEEPYRGPMYNA